MLSRDLFECTKENVGSRRQPFFCRISPSESELPVGGSGDGISTIVKAASAVQRLSYCFHGMFAALLSKPIQRTRDVGIEEELNNHFQRP